MSSDASVVQHAIDEVRRRWRRLSALQLFARAAAGVAGAWLLARLLVAAGPGDGRLAAAAGLVAVVASAAWLGGLAWRRRGSPGDRELARLAEERCPALDDRLATAVDARAREGQVAGPLHGALLADAARVLREVSLDNVVPREATRRAGAIAAAMAVLLGIAAALWVEPGRRAVHAVALYAFPGSFSLEVAPGHATLRRGQPLLIRVRTSAAAGGITPELTVWHGDDTRSGPMVAAEGDAFAWRFETVPASFTYRVAAAGRTSDTYSVRVIDPPRVERIDLQYRFPPYTRLEPRTEEDGGDIFAPGGSTVTLSVHASKPIASAALALADGTRVPLEAIGPDRLAGTLRVAADGAYRVALTDVDGLRSEGDTEYFIRVLQDRPPDVRILRPAGDRQVTALEEVDIEARADDDYGVGAFDLVYSVRGAKERVVPFAGERSPLTVTGRHTLHLEDLDVQPGDFVTYYARVRDVARGRRSTEARSDIFFLEVKPFEEEFAAAQSQAMSGAGGSGSLDDLVTAQKEIVVATWKLDRRTSAGRSAQDVKAVGRAQGALKARAEQAAAQARPRRRIRPPQPTGTTAPEDPMTAAVAAMGRAQTALEAVRTADAIPAEMEALNHLLRAQAEIRRREVMRQQAGATGGGGSNRAQQDLSSLFDRELQRQQQTNYETPQNTAEQQEQSGNEALDKVKELARRQEQLAREQDDLARDREKMAAEELKRRLARLTREQSELRQQAEQLARQLAEQQAKQRAGAQDQRQAPGQPSPGQQAQGQASPGQPQGSSGGQAQAAAEAGAQLRDASEDMRGAASELRRDDPRQASARSSRALERLRALERQLQGTEPDHRRRALGDLQLEARQLAERQRDLGQQAAGTRGRPDAGDARRRTAGEQERLAERASRLERQVKELASSGGEGRDGEAVGQAAREMEQQRIAERMQDAARTLRAGEAGEASDRAAASAAETAREVARAMDRVADRLGAASGTRDTESEAMGESLARARELREELGDLQRRIGELRRAQEQEQQQAQERGDQGSASDKARSASARAKSGTPAAGNQSGPGGPGEPGRAEQLQQLQEQYGERMRQAAELQREAASGGQQTRGGGMATPEGQQAAVSAPGTEAFKQDFSTWETLHKDVTLGLERLEASLSQALLERASRDRLRAGAADRAPDEYQRAVDQYFRSLTATKP